jgi:hypothetical protein
MLSIAIGLPSRPQFATEGDEPDGGQYDNGIESLLSVIYGCLKAGDKDCAHAVSVLADCLDSMAAAASKGNDKDLRRLYEQALEIAEAIRRHAEQEDPDAGGEASTAPRTKMRHG